MNHKNILKKPILDQIGKCKINGKFYHRHHLTKRNQNHINNLKSSITTSEKEPVIKTLPTSHQKRAKEQIVYTQHSIQFSRRVNANIPQIILPNSLYEAKVNLDIQNT